MVIGGGQPFIREFVSDRGLSVVLMHRGRSRRQAFPLLFIAVAEYIRFRKSAIVGLVVVFFKA
jgi:hypothetical protein